MDFISKIIRRRNHKMNIVLFYLCNKSDIWNRLYEIKLSLKKKSERYRIFRCVYYNPFNYIRQVFYKIPHNKYIDGYDSQSASFWKAAALPPIPKNRYIRALYPQTYLKFIPVPALLISGECGSYKWFFTHASVPQQKCRIIHIYLLFSNTGSARAPEMSALAESAVIHPSYIVLTEIIRDIWIIIPVRIQKV